MFNATDSARAGKIVTLQGHNFGPAPEVRMAGAGAVQPVTLPVVNRMDDWVAVRLPDSATGAIILEVVNGNRVSAPVRMNAAKAFHMDSLQIAPGGTFRIFGRNLLLPGFRPAVTVGGQAAEVRTAESDEHMLTVVAPRDLSAAAGVAVSVDNGNGAGGSVAERRVDVINASGDPFRTNVGWTGVFAPLVNRVIELPCDGGPMSEAIRGAIATLSAKGGGVVQLGAGVCTLADGIAFKDNIILQGAGKDRTVLRYSRNYPIWAENVDRIAIRNMTFLNSGAAEEGPLVKNSRQVVLQNVSMRFGTQKQSFFTDNVGMIVSGCDFYQLGSISQQSPYVFNGSRGLIFTGNYTQLVMGAAAFERTSDSHFQGNRFVRDAAAQNDPGTIHMMTIDFASRIAVIGNEFATLGGAITNRTRNDGEALLTEGGGPNRTENLGLVSAATATTLSDPKLPLRTDPFNTGRLPETYGVAIVGGTGAGQTRYVTAFAGGTMTVDRPWDVIPDNSSRYATFVWGLEKSILKGNSFHNMPRGIWLYQAAIRDVDVVGNVFVDGGGIYLRSFQNLDQRMFDPIYNIRIANNSVTNKSGHWSSYMNAIFVNNDARAFGIGMLNIAFYDNELVANVKNIESQTEEYAGSEGYFSMMRVENYDRYEPMAPGRVLGTVFQGNNCVNCATDYRVGTGANGTIISGARRSNSGKLFENWKTTMASELALNTVVE